MYICYVYINLFKAVIVYIITENNGCIVDYIAVTLVIIVIFQIMWRRVMKLLQYNV